MHSWYPGISAKRRKPCRGLPGADVGFNRQEAVDFVAARKEEQAKLDFKRGAGRIQITPVEVKLTEDLDVSAMPAEIRRKVQWNKKDKTLTITAPMSEEEAEEVQAAAVMEDTRGGDSKGGGGQPDNGRRAFSDAFRTGRNAFMFRKWKS